MQKIATPEMMFLAAGYRPGQWNIVYTSIWLKVNAKCKQTASAKMDNIKEWAKGAKKKNK